MFLGGDHIIIDKEKLGEKIRMLRKSHNMSQKMLGRSLALDRSMISYYESGKSLPSLETLVLMTSLFKVTPNDLLGVSHDINL